MRARDAGLGPASDVVEIAFESRPLSARRGEILAAALTAAGERTLRTTASGAPRGLFCGMGVCQDCLVEVDGSEVVRACMTKVTGPVSVRRQPHRVRTIPVEVPALAPDPAPPPRPEVLVLGGGAGGLTAAAVAAEAGVDVLLVDERPELGGQFFKQPLAARDLEPARFDDRQFADGRRLIRRTIASGATIMQGADVIGVFEPLDLVVAHEGRLRMVRPKRLIVATGAYERPLHVSGWTLPGVMTTGAAQTLMRSYRVLTGRRILVAGNGPLNLQVALELARAGAEVAAVAELAPSPGRSHMATALAMLGAAPGLTWRGMSYLAGLRRRRIPVIYRCVLARIELAAGRLRATVTSWPGPERNRDRTFEVDAVLMNYGFQPADELLRALGCSARFDAHRGHLVVERDGACRTSIPNVFAVGDGAGLNGAHAAEADGLLAGLAVARSLGRPMTEAMGAEERRALRARARHARFQAALWQLFRAPRPGLALADPETILCRCEEVTVGELRATASEGRRAIGALKRTTRAGMGRCQGRFCGPAVAEFLAESGGLPLDADAFFAPRPPVKPVPLGQIAALDPAGPDPE